MTSFKSQLEPENENTLFTDLWLTFLLWMEIQAIQMPTIPTLQKKT